jgi:hypothetical protein
MRISISTLPSPEAKSLADTLEKAGHLIVEDFPSYTVDIRFGPKTIIDVPDAMFGRLAVFRIGELTSNPVRVQVSGGNLDDRKIVVRTTPEDLEAVCVGILRAVDQTKQFTLPKEKALADTNTELFVNLWESVKRDQATFLEAQHKLSEDQSLSIESLLRAQTIALSNSVFDKLGSVHTDILSSLALDQEETNNAIKKLSNDLIANTAIIVDHASDSRKELFSDLMAYYTRKRWWEFWRS